jgi:hypothetical protein
MSHVAWPKLLPLALRLRAAEAILESGTPLEQFEAEGPARALLDTWQHATTGQLASAGRERRSDEEADAEGPAIDAYLGRVGTQLRQQGAALAGRSVLAGQLFQVLLDAHDDLTCIACCERPAPQPPLLPCRWTRSSGASDNKSMDERGGCIRAVREIFKFAAEASGQAYEQACGAALETQLHMHTGHGARNGELNLAINAETTPHPDDEMRTRNVRFVFDVETVSVDDLHAMAYIAVHECVAHGFCGVDITAPEATISVPFHEGWMDCVAAFVLGLAVSPGCVGYARQFANGFQRGMVSARAVRYSRSNPGHAKDLARWSCGRQAYEAFERLARIALERSTPDRGIDPGWRARELVAQFSLAVNASNISHEERSTLCTTVNRFYGAEEDSRAVAQIARRPQVIDFIEAFSMSLDFRTLFHAVSTIR